MRELEQTIKYKTYLKLPIVEWDGGPLCSYLNDQYFSCIEELEDYCAEEDVMPNDLMLVPCKQIKLRQIDVDLWYDLLPEDCELPSNIVKKIDELNQLLLNAKIGWEADNTKRVDMQSERT